jgi:GT2 family glycosyltransferase
MTTVDPLVPPTPQAGTPVLVSVVVNTVDRADSLATLLAALEHQSYPHFEVVVVVGPTHDRTLEVLAPYGSRVRVLRCPRANLSESRNIGLLGARGEIVAFIDDDAVPSYHWLAQVVVAFADPMVAVVGGSVYLIHPAQPAIQHWLGIMSDLGEQQDVRLAAPSADNQGRPEGMVVFWTERPMGANMALRRRTLLAEGGFDGYFEWVFDDADVAMRLALAGHAVRSLTEAPVYHVPASSRNRVARTYSGRWWIVTKASTYFAVQNGRTARQPAGQILLRVLHQVHGAWVGNWQLFHYGHISRAEMWRRRLRAVFFGAQGAAQGLGARRLLPPAARTLAPGAEPFVPFLHSGSENVAAVDPISGAVGSGPFMLPPLRIGILDPAFAPASPSPMPEAQLAAVTAALFGRGHIVHLLTAAEERSIIFQDGAYIHAELQGAGEAAVAVGVRRLVHNDGIQLLVGPPAALAAVAGHVGAELTAAGLRADLRTALQPLLAEGWVCRITDGQATAANDPADSAAPAASVAPLRAHRETVSLPASDGRQL